MAHPPLPLTRLTLESCQRPLRFDRRCSQDLLGHEFTERGSVLEAVARSTTDDPDIRGGGMPIDDEVLVRGFLVLTDARVDQRRAGEGWEAASEQLACQRK